MIEQQYFVDPNTIKIQKPVKVFGKRVMKGHVIANGVPPHQAEEFIMVDKTYEPTETVRKLVSLRQRPVENLELGLDGTDFILGPNVDETIAEKNGVIALGNPEQLRAWVRNSLRRNK